MVSEPLLLDIFFFHQILSSFFGCQILSSSKICFKIIGSLFRKLTLDSTSPVIDGCPTKKSFSTAFCSKKKIIFNGILQALPRTTSLSANFDHAPHVNYSMCHCQINIVDFDQFNYLIFDYSIWASFFFVKPILEVFLWCVLVWGGCWRLFNVEDYLIVEDLVLKNWMLKIVISEILFSNSR